MRQALIVLCILSVGCLSPSPGQGNVADDQAASQAIWETLDTAPEGRTELAATWFDGRIHVVGGFTGSIAATGGHLAFDPTTGAWETLPSLPVPVHHHALAVQDGLLLAIGGYHGIPFIATDEVWGYQPGGPAWLPLPPLPVARGAHQAVNVGNEIVVLGGIGQDGQPVLQVDILESGTRREGAPMPAGREHFAAGLVGDEVVVAMGRVGGFDTNMATAAAYNVTTHTWRELASGPTARGGVGGTTWGGRLVVVGGEGNQGTFTEVEAWGPNGWESLAPLPEGRHGLGVVTHEGTLYAIMGGPEPNLSVSDSVYALAVATGPK